MNFKAFGIFNAEFFKFSKHGGVTANEYGHAVAILSKLHSGAQHDVFFSLGKDNAFRVCTG